MLRTTDDDRAAKLLAATPWVASVGRQDGRLVVETPAEQAAAVSRILAQEQIWLTELRAQENNLEDFFLEVTSAPTTASSGDKNGEGA
jgi:hypothetical protein